MARTVTPSGAYLEQIRADLDIAIGTPLQYTGTVDGAWTLIAADLAFRVDEGIALALSTTLLDTAPPEVVVARALDAGLTPRPATFSRYIVESAGTGSLPFGTEVQGGGPLGRSRWTVVDATASVTPGSKVTIESVDGGVVTLPTTQTLSLVTPVPGITSLTYDAGDGDAYQVGRAAESTAQLRVRVRRASAAEGTAPGIVAALLAIPWVVAVDAVGSAGTFTVTVAPGPVGADQEAELGAALYAALALGGTALGSDTVPAVDVNGDAITIAFTPGATEAVAVVVVLTLDGTVSEADAIAGATAVIEAAFATLAPGDPIYRLAVLGALANVAGVIAATLTIDGLTSASVSPANAADVLTASPITVTAP